MREERRVAGGLRYEGWEEENDRMENGRWCKGPACWVALMMSWGAVGEESEKKICGHMTEDEEEE